MITGADISFWQDDNSTPQKANFTTMREAGAEFVIIRAGQNKWSDPDFADNWQKAKGILPRGSYFFYDSRVPARGQAELYVKTLGGDLGELPLWCDFEDTYGGNYGGWANWYVFIERLKDLVPRKEIGIYTGYYYWREAMTFASKPTIDYFHQFPLWIANYRPNYPLVPKPWAADEWTFWQFTPSGDGKMYGVESKEIDLNYYNGDLPTFRKRFGLSATQALAVRAVFEDVTINYEEQR